MRTEIKVGDELIDRNGRVFMINFIENEVEAIFLVSNDGISKIMTSLKSLQPGYYMKNEPCKHEAECNQRFYTPGKSPESLAPEAMK